MRLLIVAGYREFLLPREVPRERLQTMLRELEPGVRWPDPVWAPRTTAYDQFILEDEARTLLLLEYLRDVCGPDGSAAIVVPIRSCLPERKLDAAAQIDALYARAVAYLGEDAVRTVSVSWSHQARDALRALRKSTGQAPTDDVSLRDLSGPGRVEGPLEERFREIAANFTQSVLSLGVSKVRERSLLSPGAGRPELVADHLYRNRLSLTDDVDPEELLAGLAPGGMLHTLLSSTILPEMPELSPTEPPKRKPSSVVAR